MSQYSHHNIGFPHSSVGKESTYCRRPRFNSWIRKICWRRDGLPTPVFLGFPCGSAGKESACNAGDLGLIPGLGRSPGEGKGYPLQYSGLENSMDSPWGRKESDMTEQLSLCGDKGHTCPQGVSTLSAGGDIKQGAHKTM